MGSIAFIALIAVLLPFLLKGDGSQASRQIDAYVYDSCGGCFADSIPCKPCTVVLEMEQYLADKLEKTDRYGGFSVQVHNLLFEAEQEKLERRLPKEKWMQSEYPILFIGSKQFSGWEQIQGEFDRITGVMTERGETSAPLVRAEQEVVVSFKMQGCRSCEETEQLLEQLEAEFLDCRFIRYDIEESDYLMLWRQYCLQYDIDPTVASVPMLFIGDSVLEGFEEAEMFLETYLKAGYARRTYCTEEQE